MLVVYIVEDLTFHGFWAHVSKHRADDCPKIISQTVQLVKPPQHYVVTWAATYMRNEHILQDWYIAAEAR